MRVVVVGKSCQETLHGNWDGGGVKVENGIDHESYVFTVVFVVILCF